MLILPYFALVQNGANPFMFLDNEAAPLERLPWAQEVSPPSFYDHVVGVQIEHSFYSSSDNRGLGLARI